jgi:sodium pump decarboxylase gamma subunit
MWLQSIVGISVVFLALIALSFAIYVFGKVMANGNGKKERKSAEMKLENIKSVEVEADVEDDGELIAVITAAIQASLVKAGISPECKIVVKSFKRVDSGAPVWNTVNRKELLN